MDTIDRQRSQEELQKSNEQLEIILQSIADGITVQDAHGLIYANEAAARLMGYPSVAAMLATPLPEIMKHFQLIDESDEPFPLSQLPGKKAFQGESNISEILLRYRVLPKGEEGWGLVKSTPVFNAQGEVQFTINIFHDITSRKQAEEAQCFLADASEILASSLDYQTTLENLARLAVPKLADWCAVDMLDDNQEIQRLAVVHIDPSQVQWARELQQRYPPCPNAPFGVPNVLRTGKSELYSEISDSVLVAVSRDAEHLEILRNFGFSSAMVVPLSARGRTLGTITFVYTTSGRRYSQLDLTLAEDLCRRAALAVDNSRLFTELNRLTSVLGQTNAALEKRNQELDEFAYIISHDLKAPLRAIANLSTWIEEDISDRLTEETQHQMTLLRSRVYRMEALINGVLQYSRAGRMQNEVESVDVAALIADVVDSLAPPPTFTITVQPGMPTLTTERLPLQQVFANLIGNAIKHHHQTDGTVTISVQNEGELYEFLVADDGPGIAPEYQKRVFGMFQTLSEPNQVANTGVGLAIVKKIVEQKGGAIRLESQPGKGAKFYFYWPNK